MYMTFFAGSPCEKTVSFPSNLSTFLPRPAESRSEFTSNAGTLRFAFLWERRGLTGLRRTTEGTIAQISMDSAACSILDRLRTGCGQAARVCADRPASTEFQVVLRIA